MVFESRTQAFKTNTAFYLIMATLLHFLRSLAVTLVAGFLLSVSVLGCLLGVLVALNVSPLGIISNPIYEQMSRFLMVFGGGDRLEGVVAIALTLGVVASLLNGFSAYKRSQRSEWQLAATKDGSY